MTTARAVRLTALVALAVIVGVVGAESTAQLSQCRPEVHAPVLNIANMDGALSAGAGDFDGDGDLDIAAASHSAGTVVWHANMDGRGVQFGRARPVASGVGGVRQIWVGDVDGDGDPDVAAASVDGDQVGWYANTDGRGTFAVGQIVTTAADGARSVVGVDIDGDGDMDLVAASYLDDTVAWFANTDGLGTFGPPQTVSTDSDGARRVSSADVNGDGFPDLLVASYVDDTVAWFSNMDGAGSFGPRVIVSTAADAARAALGADLDGDGDVDVVSVSYLDDKLAWYPNMDGAGSFGPQIVISSSQNGAEGVVLVDMDGDGDVDIAVTANLGDSVSWFENLGAAAFGPERVVTSDANGAYGLIAADMDADGRPDLVLTAEYDDVVTWARNANDSVVHWSEVYVATDMNGAWNIAVADLDGDGDNDIVAAVFQDNVITWYENRDGLGGFSHGRTISSTANGAAQVAVGDIDGDGDNDVASASFDDGTVAWYPNTDGAGTFGAINVVTSTADGARSVYLADLDGDGDLDIATVAYNEGTVSWYLNTNGAGTFGSRSVVSSVPGSGPMRVIAADLDGDGDSDLVSAFYDTDTVAWYSNTDGAGTFAAASVVTTAADGATSVVAADLDGDGDLDLASASELDDTIAWYPNTDGAGTFGARLIVSIRANGAYSVYAADVDGDGDQDLASASIYDDMIAWYDNLNGTLAFGPERIVSTNADWAYDVVVADMDGDGANDFVSASWVSDKIAWYRRATLPLEPGHQDVISSSLDLARSVFVADLDGDGDLDIAVAAYSADKICWFPNDDGAGAFGAERIVSTSADGVYTVHAADLDGDGDMDLVAASYLDDTVAWYPNTDGTGVFGPPQTVTSTADGARSVFAADLDGDGDLDLAIISYEDDTVAWFANTDGLGTFGPQTTVTTGADAGRWITAADLDSDGDMDLVSASELDDTIAWYSNTDGLGSFGPPLTVTTAADSVRCVVAADFNGDGAPDLASASADDSTVAWYPNTDGSGTFGARQIVTTAAARARAVFAADLDGDGDIDLASASSNDDKIAWYPNTDGLGTFGAQIVVTTEANGAYSVFVADIDGDGDMDFVAASESDDEVSWIPMLSHGAFMAVAPSTHEAPNVPTFPHCLVPSSPACLSAQLTGLSRCVRDTLVLAPGDYTCPTGRHIHVTRPSRLVAAVPSTAVFACDGGVLLQARTEGVYVGDLELVGLTVSGSGSGTDGGTAVPGLRAHGAGARLALIDSTVSTGTSLVSPVHIGGGTGGCLLASSGGSVVLSRSSVANCSASQYGGGVCATGPGSTVELVDSTVSGSSAVAGGGAASTSSGLLTLVNSDIVDNTASSGGGGVGVVLSGVVAVAGGRIAGNRAAEAGGGLWVQPHAVADLSGVSVTDNTANLGGGVAAALEIVASSRASSVSDVPMASDISAAGPSAMNATLTLADTVLKDNTAAKWGGAVYACEARVDVSGGSSDWSNNVVHGASSGAQSSADAFLCVPGPAAGFAPSRTTPDGIPWLRIASPLFPLPAQAWRIHTPLAALAWVNTPATAVEAGGSVTASVRATDWFGSPVEYVNSLASVAFADTGLLGPLDLAKVSLGSSRVPLPPAVLRVADPSLAPANISFTVSVDASGGAGGLAVAGLEWTVEVGMCGIGRGGAVEDGLTQCLACTSGTESLEVSFAACVSQGVCPINTLRVSDGTGAEPCVCARGFWTPSGRVNEPCVACPAGGVCDGGTTRPVAAPGYFPESAGSTLFLECPNPQACSGGGSCRAGYRGRLCAQCDDDYYALRGSCFKCKTGVNMTVTVLLVLGSLAVCAALLGFSLSESMRYKFAAAMIGINALQVSALYGRIELPWGDFAAVYFDVSSSLNVNVELTSPECSLAAGTDVWVIKLVATLALPVVSALGLSLVAPAFVVVSSKSLGQIASAWARAWFQSLVLLYLPLTSAALSVFGCRKDKSERWVLDADPARSCYTTAWWSGLFPIGLVATLVYAFALPVGVVRVLRARRETMDPVGFALRFGFLVGRFTDEAWWFEAAIMGRKLLVVLCMTFFFTAEGKAYAAVFALIGTFVQLVYVRPYGSPFHFWLAVTVLASTISVLYSGTFVDSTFRKVGITGGIIVNVLAIVVGNGVDVWLIAQAEAKVHEQEFYQPGVVGMDTELGGGSHDSRGAGMTSVELDDLGVVSAPQTAEVGHHGIVGSHEIATSRGSEAWLTSVNLTDPPSST